MNLVDRSELSKYRFSVIKGDKVLFKRTKLSFDTILILLALSDRMFKEHDKLFTELKVDTL